MKLICNPKEHLGIQVSMNYSLEWFKRSKGGRGGAENQANIVLRGFAIKGNRKGLIASRGYVFKKGAIVFIFF